MITSVITVAYVYFYARAQPRQQSLSDGNVCYQDASELIRNYRCQINNEISFSQDPSGSVSAGDVGDTSGD